MGTALAKKISFGADSLHHQILISASTSSLFAWFIHLNSSITRTSGPGCLFLFILFKTKSYSSFRNRLVLNTSSSESDWFAAARFSLRAQGPYTKGVHKSSR